MARVIIALHIYIILMAPVDERLQWETFVWGRYYFCNYCDYIGHFKILIDTIIEAAVEDFVFSLVFVFAWHFHKFSRKIAEVGKHSFGEGGLYI